MIAIWTCLIQLETYEFFIHSECRLDLWLTHGIDA